MDYLSGAGPGLELGVTTSAAGEWISLVTEEVFVGEHLWMVGNPGWFFLFAEPQD
jgi:hypothetical protein